MYLLLIKAGREIVYWYTPSGKVTRSPLKKLQRILEISCLPSSKKLRTESPSCSKSKRLVSCDASPYNSFIYVGVFSNTSLLLGWSSGISAVLWSTWCVSGPHFTRCIHSTKQTVIDTKSIGILFGINIAERRFVRSLAYVFVFTSFVYLRQ